MFSKVFTKWEQPFNSLSEGGTINIAIQTILFRLYFTSAFEWAGYSNLSKF